MKKTNLMLAAMTEASELMYGKVDPQIINDYFTARNTRLVIDEVENSLAPKVAASDKLKATFNYGDIVLVGNFIGDYYLRVGEMEYDFMYFIGRITNTDAGRGGVHVQSLCPLVGWHRGFERTYPPLYIAKVDEELERMIGLRKEAPCDIPYTRKTEEGVDSIIAKVNFKITCDYNINFPKKEPETIMAIGCQRIHVLQLLKLAAIAKELLTELNVPLLTYEELAYAETKGLLDYFTLSDHQSADMTRMLVNNIKEGYIQERTQFIERMTGKKLPETAAGVSELALETTIDTAHQ